MKGIFSPGSFLGYRIIVVSILSLTLLMLDTSLNIMNSVRTGLTVVVTPVHWTASLPGRMFNWAEGASKNRNELVEENSKLKTEALVLKQKVQQMAALEAQNAELRELLNASELVDDRVLVAEMIGVDPDPYTHQVIVNRGEKHGVFLGQPVLDSNGLMGQVVKVGQFTSRVMLIADSNHAIPVQVNRNGVRAIAVGSSKLDEIQLIYVPDTADIREGDLLVSSGLGQRFPSGYPVGVVQSVEHDPGEAFAIVSARPSAHLDRSRHVLLVFSEQTNPIPNLLGGKGK